MDLYLDRHPDLVKEFRKEAGFSARLSDQAETWAEEATSELLKQHPYFSDYELSPLLDRTEPQRGYGFGYVDITNRTERPEAEHEEAGIPHIRVPIVVQERQLRPFSIFLDGERVMPLNEDRVRNTLFQPNTFDLSVVPPVDPTLVENFMPPTRSGIGVGGEYKTASARFSEKVKQAFSHITAEQWSALYKNPKIQKLLQTVGKYDHPEVDNMVFEIAAKRYGYHAKSASARPLAMAADKMAPRVKKSGFDSNHVPATTDIKIASVKPPLLKAIAGTIDETSARAFIDKLANDKTLQVGFKHVKDLLVDVFDNTKRASVDDRLQIIADEISPTVVTMQRLPGGSFLVKAANVNAFAGGPQTQGQVMPEQQVAQDLGPGVTDQMKPGQTATATADPVQNTDPAAGFDGQPVAEFGEYTVQDTLGNTLMGWVIPQLLAWDGNFSPMSVALFTNGSAYAMQDSIIGKMVGKGVGMPVDEPRGEGVFYNVNNEGVLATCPLTVNSAMAGPDGRPMYQGVDPFGNPVVVRTVAGLLNPERISNAEYALPEGWQFMRLNNQTQLAGAQQAGQQDKTTAAREKKSSVTLFYNGAYQLVGECGLDKIATEYRYDLDAVSAEFMLGLLGVDGSVAKQKVAEARKKGEVKLAGLKTITLLGERHAQAVKHASAFLAEFPDLRKDLIKEAATIHDEGTVDKVLALNFINPENIGTFVDYLPEMEEASEQLAEMLIHSYLGMETLPESALERSMRGMEEVVSSLKAMQQTHQEA